MEFQNKFIGTGQSVFLPFQAVDKFESWNQTTLVGYQWFKGMNAREAFRIAADGTKSFVTTTGVSYINTTHSPYGAPIDITGIAHDAADPFVPTVTTDGNHGYQTGDIVRIYGSTFFKTLSGIDFMIEVTGNTTFKINPAQVATGVPNYVPGFPLDIMAGNDGVDGKVIKVNWQSPFYPRPRYIEKIIVIDSTHLDIYCTVPHGYSLGQKVVFFIPETNGSVELNEVIGTVTNINPTAPANLIANKNSLEFYVELETEIPSLTPFTWPLVTISGAVSFAQVTPYGTDTAFALRGTTENDLMAANPMNSAQVDRSYIGLLLEPGTNGPAGALGDVIWWSAEKAFSNNIEPVNILL